MTSNFAFTLPVPLTLSSSSPSTSLSHRPPCASASPSPPTESSRTSRVCFPPPNHWANPSNQVLTPRGSGLHTIDRTYNFLAFDVGARCTLLSNAAGDLLAYSPLPITPALASAIAAIGTVTVVIAPNNEHVDFVLNASTAFPSATILGPSSCVERWPDLPFDADVFGPSGDAHPSLAAFDTVTPLFVPSAPFFNETVLIQQQPGEDAVLVVCDLFWNWPTRADAADGGYELPLPTTVWAAAMNRVYAPVYNRILVRDRLVFRQFFSRLRGMRPERIVPCHGACVEEDGVGVLERFLPEFLTAEALPP